MEKKFYAREAEEVARSLLGKYLVRRGKKGILKGKIVETEAYYGKEDPASRAYNGKTKLSEGMWDAPGTIFIYNVHQYWMLNFITGKKGNPQGVLIRAIEPLEGIELMKKNRSKENIKDLCSGPGKLTIAFGIDKALHRKKVNLCDLRVTEGERVNEIATSNRIGVSKGLSKHLRFYIKDNKFISK